MKNYWRRQRHIRNSFIFYISLVRIIRRPNTIFRTDIHSVEFRYFHTLDVLQFESGFGYYGFPGQEVGWGGRRGTGSFGHYDTGGGGCHPRTTTPLNSLLNIAVLHKAWQRSNFGTRIINHFPGLSFPKTQWSVVTFFIVFQRFGSKAHIISKRNSLYGYGGDKHVSDLPHYSSHFLAVCQRLPHQRSKK